MASTMEGIRYHRGRDTSCERGYDAGEPTYGTNEARRKGGRHFVYQPEPEPVSDAAVPDIDIQRSPGADDDWSKGHPTSSRAAAYRVREYYV